MGSRFHHFAAALSLSYMCVVVLLLLLILVESYDVGRSRRHSLIGEGDYVRSIEDLYLDTVRVRFLLCRRSERFDVVSNDFSI